MKKKEENKKKETIWSNLIDYNYGFEIQCWNGYDVVWEEWSGFVIGNLIFFAKCIVNVLFMLCIRLTLPFQSNTWNQMPKSKN